MPERVELGEDATTGDLLAVIDTRTSMRGSVSTEFLPKRTSTASPYHPGGIGDIEKEAYVKTPTYTPVTGGVGPMTIATLMCQTVEAAERGILHSAPAST